MALQFTCPDYEGVPVSCGTEVWRGHILKSRMGQSAAKWSPLSVKERAGRRQVAIGKPSDNEVAALLDVDAPTSAMLRWDDERLASLAHAYYPDADIFYLREEPVQAADNLHTGRYAVLRLHPETNEVLGAHVEGWERFFLPLYTEFRDGWEQIIKPHLANDRQASAEEIAQYNLALIHRILDWLRESERPARKRTRASA